MALVSAGLEHLTNPTALENILKLSSRRRRSAAPRLGKPISSGPRNVLSQDHGRARRSSIVRAPRWWRCLPSGPGSGRPAPGAAGPPAPRGGIVDRRGDALEPISRLRHPRHLLNRPSIKITALKPGRAPSTPSSRSGFSYHNYQGLRPASTRRAAANGAVAPRLRAGGAGGGDLLIFLRCAGKSDSRHHGPSTSCRTATACWWWQATISQFALAIVAEVRPVPKRWGSAWQPPARPSWGKMLLTTRRPYIYNRALARDLPPASPSPPRVLGLNLLGDRPARRARPEGEARTMSRLPRDREGPSGRQSRRKAATRRSWRASASPSTAARPLGHRGANRDGGKIDERRSAIIAAGGLPAGIGAGPRARSGSRGPKKPLLAASGAEDAGGPRAGASRWSLSRKPMTALNPGEDHRRADFYRPRSLCPCTCGSPARTPRRTRAQAPRPGWGCPGPRFLARISYPHQLSGGQRQRVVIAIALAWRARYPCSSPDEGRRPRVDVTIPGGQILASA